MIRNIEIVKLKENAIIPTYGSECAAGLDLCACLDNPITITSGDKATLVPTGISINLMTSIENCVGFIFPRSGLGHKNGLILGNGVGVIDMDYRGEIFVSLWNRNNPNIPSTNIINHGDRIAQLVIVPIIVANFKIVDKFAESTQRGINGFGSTGV